MILICSGANERGFAPDSLACAGAVLASVWSDARMPVVDELGEEFMNYVKDGMKITIKEDGTVLVD